MPNVERTMGRKRFVSSDQRVPLSLTRKNMEAHVFPGPGTRLFVPGGSQTVVGMERRVAPVAREEMENKNNEQITQVQGI